MPSSLRLRPTLLLAGATAALLAIAPLVCPAAAQLAVHDRSGLTLVVDSTDADPVLLLQLPDPSIGPRSIRVLVPEHVTVRTVGASDSRQLYKYDPQAHHAAVAWTRQAHTLAYHRELVPGLTLDVAATLEPDGMRLRYTYANRTDMSYALVYGATDPRMTGALHDDRLQRTWVHRASGFALLASDFPERLTLPLDRWLPARVLDSYTWPVPAEKIRREDGIAYYNASQPVDEPMLSTVSADGRWVVTSFTATTGNVWSNPELTCQHVDPEPPLPAHGTAVVEVKLLITRGTLDDALRAVRAQRRQWAAASPATAGDVPRGSAHR